MYHFWVIEAAAAAAEKGKTQALQNDQMVCRLCFWERDLTRGDVFGLSRAEWPEQGLTFLQREFVFISLVFLYNSIKLHNILKFVIMISLYIKFVIIISLYVVINYTKNLLLKGKYEFKNTSIIFRCTLLLKYLDVPC